jgi:hypothetical protein
MPAVQSFLYGLATRRRKGDFTIADMRSALISFALSTALIIFGGFALRYTYKEAANPYNDSEYMPERVAVIIAISLGLIHSILSAIEYIAFERRLPRRLSRRRFFLRYEQNDAKRVRQAQGIFTVPLFLLCLGPLTSRGFVTPSWIACWACLALLGLVTLARSSRFGDAAFIAAAALLILANCLPIEYDPGPNQATGFYSGLQTTGGMISFVVGLLMTGAWWWRIPTPLLTVSTGLGGLSLLASAADALRGDDPHWFVSIIALATAGLSLVFGAGKLLPLHAAPISPPADIAPVVYD